MSTSTLSKFTLASLLLATALLGQEFRATITGTVLDPSGAGVPNASIEVRSSATSAPVTAKTNDTGSYSVPFLTPGTYSVKIAAGGFKTFTSEGVELHAGDKLQVDARLQVGALTETVIVNASNELLQTATAAMGQAMSAEQVKDLPLMGRNTLLAATLSTGVYSGLFAGQESQLGRPFDGAAAQMSVGGLGSAYQIYLNGIPNAPEERASAAIYVGFVPSPDAVEEVNVQTNLYDAQYGHTSGAVVNTVLKGGTNSLHGTAYEFFRNDKLNANNFQSNLAGAKRAIMRWNQPGFVIDGPVWIPKVYNGKDKTFFMVSGEIVRNSNPTPLTASVPLAAQHKGDFSQLIQSNGQPILIYDPATYTLTNGQYLRQPFPNNIIPANRISPVGQALINLYPLPNVAGNAQGFNNYVNSPNSQTDQYHSVSIRIDHQINANNRITGTAVTNQRHQHFPDAGFPDPAAVPPNGSYLHYRNNHGASADWTATLSPTTVLDVKYGFIFHPFQLQYYGDNYDLTKIGFSQTFASQVPHSTFPGVNLSNGYTSLQNDASQYSTTVDHSLSGTLNKTVGKHTLKAGGELFVMKANNITPISNVNAFSFNAGFTQQNAQTGSAAAGNPLASMLLGYASGGGVSYNIASAFQQIYYGAFVQDSWRVNDRFTLTLGLRWDYEGPMSERYNRQNDGFDFNATNPLQSQVTGLSLKGGLLFTDANNRLPFKRDLNNWGPRIGGSYRLFKNTVLRGGYGITYEPTFQSGNANGFNSTTGYIASNDANITPAGNLVNPFPTGIIAPVGRTLGLSTLLGQGFTFADPQRTIPRVQQYSLGLQHQFPGQFVLEVSFAGNDATELPVSKGINALPRQYYALPGSTPLLTSAALVAQVPNPMAGLLPGSSLNNGTIAFQSLQVPFPEFGGITEQYRPLGQSLYNSMQVAGEKRFSHGLQARLSFTWDKIMQETGYLNDQDDWTNIRRSQAGEPSKILTLATTYELPWFAKGTGWKRQLFGGWEMNAVVRYFNGNLVGAPGAYSTGVNPQITDGQSYQQWFNTCSLSAAGVRQNCTSASEPVAFMGLPSNTLNTLGPVLPGIRTQIPVNVDFAIFKSFSLTEKAKMQLRANAYNLGNTPQFGGPNTSFGSANFGVITLSQVNDPRIVEVALKLWF